MRLYFWTLKQAIKEKYSMHIIQFLLLYVTVHIIDELIIKSLTIVLL